MALTTRFGIAAVVVLLLSFTPRTDSAAQVCTELQFQNYTGAGQTICPCFIAGEEAASVLDVPAGHYPIEITRIAIGWASQFGGNPAQIEQAVHLYAAGLPDPGVPIFSLVGPQLADGVINEFNIEPIPGNKVINSGPFTVSLEFFNQNAGNFSAPTVVHDGNGCQLGKTIIKAIPGGWQDACLAGVTGDWVMYAKYRSLAPIAAASPTNMVFSGVPANQASYDTIYVSNDGCDTLVIDGISGCDVAPFSIDTTMTNHTLAPGETTPIVVCVMPTVPDTLMCQVAIVSNARNGVQLVDVSVQTVTAIGSQPLASALAVTVYPNPFNPTTTIRFTLPSALPVSADVYSVDGSRVRSLARDQIMVPGANVLAWDGRADNGQPVASGVYLVRVVTPVGSSVTRAVLLK